VLGIISTSAFAHVRCLEAGKGCEVHLGGGNEAKHRFVWDSPSYLAKG
jgi:hypothetical protein